MSRQNISAILFLLTSFGWMSANALEIPSQETLRFYFSARGVHGEGLENKTGGRRRETEQRVRLGIRYRPMLGPYWRLTSDVRFVFANQSRENAPNSQNESDAIFEVKQLYVEAPSIWPGEFPLGISIGRKTFRDDRGWLYDNQLDVGQLQYRSTLLSGQVSAGGRIVDERVGASSDPNVGLEDTRFAIAHLDFQYYYRQHLEGFLVYQTVDAPSNQIGRRFSEDKSPQPESDFTWLGIRARGLWSIKKNPLRYWLDVATVTGSNQQLILNGQLNGERIVTGSRDIDLAGGIGLNMGLLWKSADETWGLGLDYARGSGDKRGKSRQHRYIQPEIANNKGMYLGPIRYRNYGELLRPELSNLQIFSVFGGWKVTERFWLETAYHHYRQLEADSRLVASQLLIAPNGRRKHIGDELDLMLGGRWENGSRLQLVASGFRRGDAFDGLADSRFAYRLTLEFRVYW